MSPEEKFERIRSGCVARIRRRIRVFQENGAEVPAALTALFAHAEAGDDEFCEYVELTVERSLFRSERTGLLYDDSGPLLMPAVFKPGPAPEPRSGRSANQLLPTPRARGGEHDDP